MMFNITVSSIFIFYAAGHFDKETGKGKKEIHCSAANMDTLLYVLTIQIIVLIRAAPFEYFSNQVF